MKISLFSGKWQHKITLSDYIAFVALIITAWSSFKHDKARIEYETLPIYNTAGFTNGSRGYLVRLILKNNGDKPVTVERLIKNKKDNWLIGYNEKGESMTINKRAVSLLHVVKELKSKYQFDSKNDSLQYFESNEGLTLDKVIYPGHHEQLNILLETTYLSDTVFNIHFDGTLILSDRTEVPMDIDIDLNK